MDQQSEFTEDRLQIKYLLNQRLVECGWMDEVRLLCKQILKDKSRMEDDPNIDNFTVEQLIKEVTPKARALVPDVVKQESLILIRKMIAENQMKEKKKLGAMTWQVAKKKKPKRK